MKNCTRTLVVVLALAALSGCRAPGMDREAVYQVSTLSALLEGVYDGETTCGELKRHGDLGIGTFNALDGEMVCVGGVIYQVNAYGEVHRAADDMGSPFACMTFFDAEECISLPEGMDFEGFAAYMDDRLPTPNLPHAIRIEGTFSRVKTRSVPQQTKPYRRLAEVVKDQPTFEYENVQGVMVGFRLPEYMAGINVPGYHIHFLGAEAKGGGHVLSFAAQSASAQVDTTPRLVLVLPEAGFFSLADLSSDKGDEVERVEK